jgi:hypothetical protein
MNTETNFERWYVIRPKIKGFGQQKNDLEGRESKIWARSEGEVV